MVGMVVDVGIRKVHIVPFVLHNLIQARRVHVELWIFPISYVLRPKRKTLVRIRYVISVHRIPRYFRYPHRA